ncbi:type II secretion system secretin GspD [Chromobacterium alticapitis]|uniref:Type II secretion system protein GspD n=1 Tax=Chromobacterium alticapitis TaxID=2073169 RepID=A0A2S5DHD3_9NEIS|nr:type II secretion system secretin GspD [Chromobacterium alticapitis]POZ62500.1 type II secretion system protein GspD [Chromobacterium alticapitis]
MRISKLVATLALIYSCQLLAAPQNDTVMLNFVNADIETVVKAIGEISGKNFLIDPRVKGTVNIVSSRPVPRALSYQVLLSSLRLQGFAAVEGDGVIKIVPEADAKLHARAIKGMPRGDGDRLITKVFALKNGNANQLVPVIRPLVSPNNTVAAYPQSNALIVTDYADNIRRIESIIESVEAASSGDTAVIPVLFGSAVDLASTLNKLLQDGGGAEGGKTSILADPRANMLMVRTDAPGKIGKIKSLLKMLDQPSQAGSNVRVVYLKNAQAAEIAKTLRALLASESSPVQGRSVISAAAGGGSANLMSGVSGGQSGGAAPGSGNAAPSAAPVLDNGAAAAAASSGPAGAGVAAMIQADSNSNALILNVPDPMYQNLRNVIDLLDKRRAQVYVEALVMEVTASRVNKIGVQWSAKIGQNGLAGASFPNGKPILGAPSTTDSTGLGTLVNSLTNGGLTAAIINNITVGGVQIPTLGLLAQALEQEAKGNLVASPQLVTMDNEKAKIVIGQEVGVLSASYPAGSSGTSNAPYNTYDRKTVGFALEITPQISEGGAIRLKISQAADSIDSTTLSAAAGPTFSRRMLDTVVTVNDGGLVALGGLTQDQISNAEDKVPLLGDIPYLGNLFKYQDKERKKTNLMIFIRPTIIRDEIGNSAVAGERYGYVMGDLQKQTDSKLPYDLNDALKALPSKGIRGSLDGLSQAEDKAKAAQ